MSDSWTTSGIDLHVEMKGLGRRRALEAALREAIADGRLPAGTRLPSSRNLAVDVGVARNTVVDVYTQLTAEGWLRARRGAATIVDDRPAAAAPAAAAPADSRESWRYDLRPGRPDVSSFPRSAWLAASRRAWNKASDADLDYGDPRGAIQLRAVLTGYLGRARGVRTHPSRIVVCSGFTQAFSLLCHALRQQGASSVAVESYGHPQLRPIAAGAGLGAITAPLDEEGADLASGRGADAAVVTPAHQFPLGRVMSASRRHATLAWARAHGAVIVEDDYDGEFRYDRDPLGALQGLDPDRVVYVGTASKTLAPGLRLAWLVLPEYLAQPVVDVKILADRQTGILEQLTLAEFIASGAYDRHVRRRRLAYRHRRDRLVGALGTGPVQGVSAGLHALVTLADGMAEEDAVVAAAPHGLALEGLDAYRAGPASRPPALVVGYATPPEHAYEKALSILAKLLAVTPARS